MTQLDWRTFLITFDSLMAAVVMWELVQLCTGAGRRRHQRSMLKRHYPPVVLFRDYTKTELKEYDGKKYMDKNGHHPIFVALNHKVFDVSK